MSLIHGLLILALLESLLDSMSSIEPKVSVGGELDQ